MKVGQAEINFSHSARNLGVIFDSDLDMKAQVDKVCQLAYLELRRIGSIRKYLTEEATKTLVSSLVLSRLDYCNSLMAGLPKYLIQKLQKVMHYAARLIYRVPMYHSASDLLSELHWLTIENRIKYKVSCLCFSVITGSAPPYLSDLLELYTPARKLRSSSDTRTFKVPRRNKQLGERAFSHFGPVVWNSLPHSVRHSSSLPSFKKNLKTYLFDLQERPT